MKKKERKEEKERKKEKKNRKEKGREGHEVTLNCLKGRQTGKQARKKKYSPPFSNCDSNLRKKEAKQ